MKFYHKVEPEFIYTLNYIFENKYRVSWDKEGVTGSAEYTVEEVEDNLEDGTWIELKS